MLSACEPPTILRSHESIQSALYDLLTTAPLLVRLTVVGAPAGVRATLVKGNFTCGHGLVRAFSTLRPGVLPVPPAQPPAPRHRRVSHTVQSSWFTCWTSNPKMGRNFHSDPFRSSHPDPLPPLDGARTHPFSDPIDELDGLRS